jgi:hypothetical protein
MYSLFVLDEQRRIVACRDGLYPDGHLRQAKVNALRESPPPALPGTLPKYDNENFGCVFSC